MLHLHGIINTESDEARMSKYVNADSRRAAGLLTTSPVRAGIGRQRAGALS